MFNSLLGNNEAFIIAEVGQNHQGDSELALKYVREFSRIGANAIKFQTRNNKVLFSEEAYIKPYESENAFAETYGQHREALELPVDFLKELRDECKKFNVKFMSTPFDEPSLDILVELKIDILKVASFDLGNLPFIKKIAQANRPTVISVGGGNMRQIQSSVEILNAYCDQVAVLHCVSEYPCPHNRLGLDQIEKLQKLFPKNVIGLSDHFNGIISGPVSYMKGARVFEKHVTFDRTWKGTDHIFALNPDAFRKFCRDIRRIPEMLTPKDFSEIGKEAVFKKLGKSLILVNNLLAGERITIDDLSGKIFNNPYIPVRESLNVIGKRLKCDMKAGEPLQWESLE